MVYKENPIKMDDLGETHHSRKHPYKKTMENMENFPHITEISSGFLLVQLVVQVDFDL